LTGHAFSRARHDSGRDPADTRERAAFPAGVCPLSQRFEKFGIRLGTRRQKARQALYLLMLIRHKGIGAVML